MTPITPRDLLTIGKIAERAKRFYMKEAEMPEREAEFVKLATADEILIVHREIMPLRLDELLTADDFNFMHDIAGIHKHLEHGTVQMPPRLTLCFIPRCAAPKDAEIKV